MREIKSNFLIVILIFTLTTIKLIGQNNVKENFDNESKTWEISTKSFVKKNEKLIPIRIKNSLNNSFKKITIKDITYSSFYNSLINFIEKKLNIKFNKVKYLIENYNGDNVSYLLILDNSSEIELKRSGFNWLKISESNSSLENFDDKFSKFRAIEKCISKNHGGFFYRLITKFSNKSVEIKLIEYKCIIQL